MSKYNKAYLATFKGKKVCFEVVKHFGDIKVQFVDHFGDYKVKISNMQGGCRETIKIEIVDHFPDVKLEKSNFGDFEVYLK